MLLGDIIAPRINYGTLLQTLLVISAWILPRNSQVQLITDGHLSLKTNIDTPTTYASLNDRKFSFKLKSEELICNQMLLYGLLYNLLNYNIHLL